MRETFLARQPIFDRELNVRAYEVLFRTGSENVARVSDGTQATSQMLVNAFVGVGLDRVVGDRLAFVNLPREFLVGKHPLPLAPEKLVLEILEDVEIDEELVEGVRELVRQGYTLALDDVVFEERLAPLLELAKIVKVELPKIPRADWAEHLQQFRRYPVEILAEKVETQADFELCRDAGYDLFQGYFFARPQVLSARQPTSDQLAVLQLMSKLNQPDITIDDIERLLKGDPSLSFAVLRYVNSASHGQRRQVDSLRQAIAILGIKGVRTLVVLVMLSGLSSGRSETLRTAMLRALVCENLGRLSPGANANACFTAGLISMLDAVLGIPIEEILPQLPLSDEVRDGILERCGVIGETLRCAEAHERIDVEDVACGNLEASQIRDAYLSAISETDRLWSGVGSG